MTTDVYVFGVRLNDSWRRAIRTVLQLAVAVIPTLPTLAFLTDGNPPLAAALGTLIAWGAIVTKAINWLEDTFPRFKAFLKAPPSSGASPEPTPAESYGDSAQSAREVDGGSEF